MPNYDSPSETDNVPDIQAQFSRIQTLSQGVDWWNAAMIWSLVFAALAALAVVLTTRMVVVRARQLASAQDELVRAKDGQLALDLKAKDQKIAEAGEKAAEANRIAEDEKLARVKIEARVAWRRITKQQQEEIGSSLGHHFSNQGVSVWFNAGDTEGSSFAADIAEALQAAHTLRVYSPASILSLQEGGRLTEPIKQVETGVILQSTKDERSRSLADAIIRELTVRGFDAARRSDPPFDPSPIPQVWVNVEPRPEGPQGEFKLAAQQDKKK
jgi:hypothetical protein